MGVASKIPVRGEGTGGERSLRSDHQKRAGVARRSASERYFEKALFMIFRRNPALCIAAGFLPSAHFVRSGRMAGELKAIP